MDALVRNKYGLDPFQICRPEWQPLYGSQEPDSPWPLLIRGMFSFLYQEELKHMKLRAGYNAVQTTRLPPRKLILPRDWAYAFNTITKTLYESGRITLPKAPDPERGLDQEPPFRLTSSGREKVREYRQAHERLKTGRIIERMQEHAQELLPRLSIKTEADA